MPTSRLVKTPKTPWTRWFSHPKNKAMKATADSKVPVISREAAISRVLVTSQASRPTNQVSQPTSQASRPTSQASRPTSQASRRTSQASQAISRVISQASQAISQVISQVVVRVPARTANTTPTPSTPQMARPNTAMSSMNIRAMPLLTRKALMTMTSAVSLATTSATFTVMVKAAREAANKKPLPREANSRNQTKNNNY